MAERVHFTGQDARLVFLNHPETDQVGEPVDAAHFVITGGSSPVHIWNYARRKEGGAPFDDTAIGNHLAELQLVMNQERFESTEEQFRDNPKVGDMLLLYRSRADWGSRKTAGYKMLEGRVGSVGEEITLRNATYPTISIKFKEILDWRGESQQQAGRGDGGILQLSGPEERPTQTRFWPIEGYYTENARRKAFAPGRQGAPSGDPFSPSQFQAFRRHPVQYVRIGGRYDSIDGWLDEQRSGSDFSSAFIEVARPGRGGGERELYAWSTAERRYKSTGQTSAHVRTPILDAQ